MKEGRFRFLLPRGGTRKRLLRGLMEHQYCARPPYWHSMSLGTLRVCRGGDECLRKVPEPAFFFCTKGVVMIPLHCALRGACPPSISVRTDPCCCELWLRFQPLPRTPNAGDLKGSRGKQQTRHAYGGRPQRVISVVPTGLTLRVSCGLVTRP